MLLSLYMCLSNKLLQNGPYSRGRIEAMDSNPNERKKHEGPPTFYESLIVYASPEIYPFIYVIIHSIPSFPLFPVLSLYLPVGEC